MLFFLAHNYEVQAQKKHKADSTWSNWNFRISPYFWYIGFKGSIYRPPHPVNYPIPPPPRFDIDVGFKDIKNSIKFALMLAGQYRNDHIVAQFNLSSLILESEAITPYELLLQDNIVKLGYYGGDFAIGYRIVKSPKWELDGLIGVKFVGFSVGLKSKIGGILQVEGERTFFWYDPVVGMNLKYSPHLRVEISAIGDVGSTLLNAELTYQYAFAVNYLITKTFHKSLGYRLYYVETERKNAIYNGQIDGAIMKIGFQF